MNDAEKYSEGGIGRDVGVLPTRSPVLNFFLGGGLPLKAVTTISGNPGNYKTTFLHEMIAQAQAENNDTGMAMIASNEQSVSRDRVNAFGGRGEDFILLEHTPPAVILTIEYIGNKFSTYFTNKRKENLEEAVKAVRSGKCKAYLRDYYAKKLKVPKKYAKDHEYIANKMKPQKGIGIQPHMLHDDHKTFILFGIDSGTDCPSEKGLDSKGTMNEALAWSYFFKNQLFLDERTLLVIINQIRTHVSKAFQTWEDEAAPKATMFNAHCRINVRSSNKDVLRRSMDGKVAPTTDSNYKDLPVGVISTMRIDKNKRTGLDSISFPQVLWKQTGTDTPWTLHELLLRHGVITKSAGWLNMMFREEGKTALKKVSWKLAEFYNKVYLDDDLRTQIFDQVEILLNNIAKMPSDTLRYGETHEMAVEGHVEYPDAD